MNPTTRKMYKDRGTKVVLIIASVFMLLLTSIYIDKVRTYADYINAQDPITISTVITTPSIDISVTDECSTSFVEVNSPINYFEPTEILSNTRPSSYRLTSSEVCTDPYSDHYYPYYSELSLPKKLQQYTHYLCETTYTSVSYELALAVMWEESNFTVDAVGYNDGGTTDTGLMQINTICESLLIDKFKYIDLFDPYYNIEAGLYLLDRVCSEYGENCGLLAYGLGEYGMLQYTAQGNWSTYASRKVLSFKEKICNMEKEYCH